MNPDLARQIAEHIEQVRLLDSQYARPLLCSFTEASVKCQGHATVRIWCAHCGIHAGFACTRHGDHVTSGAMFLNRACGAHGPGRLINRLEAL